MRTTIEIPDELFRKAKRLAAEHDESLKTIINRALRRELESLSEKKRVRNALPNIQVSSDAPALHLTPQELKVLDAEEYEKGSTKK